jgi:hypothetical protein
LWSAADGTGASPPACCAGRVDEKGLEDKSSAHGDPLALTATATAAAWETEVEVSGRVEAERSTGARELTRLAAVRPKRSFRDAIAAAAAASSNEKMRERAVDRPSRPGGR